MVMVICLGVCVCLFVCVCVCVRARARAIVHMCVHSCVCLGFYACSAIQPCNIDNPLNTFKNHGFRPLFECGCFTPFRFDYDDPKFIELTALVNQVLSQPAFFFPANFVTALQFVPSIRKVCTYFVLNPFGAKRTRCGCRAVKCGNSEVVKG